MDVLSAAIAFPLWWLPPKKYDHPFKGELIIQYLDAGQLAAACGADSWACTEGNINGRCIIYIPRIGVHDVLGTGSHQGVNAQGQEGLIRHERSHCNGWPANHPGSRFLP